MKLAKSISEKVKSLIKGMANLFFAPSEIEERIQLSGPLNSMD